DRIVISAARELGDKSISANAVNPGPIDTGWMDDATRSGLAPHHPLGRLGTPRDIAAVTSFLISEEGRWISGQLPQSDGGFSARFCFRRAHTEPPSSTTTTRQATTLTDPDTSTALAEDSSATPSPAEPRQR